MIFSGLSYVARTPAIWQDWLGRVLHANSSPDGAAWYVIAKPEALAGGARWCFPQMALGLSGFELIMTVVPRVRGISDAGEPTMAARVRNTRKLMFVAAAVMAVYLLSAVLVTTLLVHGPSARIGWALAPVNLRPLAYVAHGGDLVSGATAGAVHPWFSHRFGDLYDLATISILCLAGASVMMGLRGLLPHYLHRLGMELSWAGRVSVILHVLNGIILLVTVVFHASLSAQQWAYATSVLVLMGGASLAATWDLDQRLAGCGYTAAGRGAVCALVRILPGHDRAHDVHQSLGSGDRSGLRAQHSDYLVLLPLAAQHRNALRGLRVRRRSVARALAGNLPIAGQDPRAAPAGSDFAGRQKRGDQARVSSRSADAGDLRAGSAVGGSEPTSIRPSGALVKIDWEESLEVIRLSKCVSVSHVLAALCLEISRVGPPPEMVFGWSIEPPLAANLNFLLLGEGNIPWMVKELVRRAIPDVISHGSRAS